MILHLQNAQNHKANDWPSLHTCFGLLFSVFHGRDEALSQVTSCASASKRLAIANRLALLIFAEGRATASRTLKVEHSLLHAADP